MRINQGFDLREMFGEHIVIASGVENIDFSKVISLNESAAYLWNEVKDKEFTPTLLAALLTERYDVPDAVALADAIELAEHWVSVGLASR